MKDTINIGDTKEMLCEMLAIPSVSGDEGALSDYIAQKLRDAGAECVRQQIVDGDRRNVFAEVTGSLPGKTILLTGHMDTVEAGDGWTVNPFAGTERDGRIYGRGANDMKAGIAIILQTVSTCVRNRGRLRGKIVVAFVCDEEAYSEGVLCAIKEGNIHADFGIAAEPEYHHAVIGSCGKVLIRAVAHGKAAHAAEAESGINAINEMSKFLSVLERVPLQTSEVMRERTVIVNSFSKSFAMTGWRIGFVAGPAEIVDRMTKCQENFNACANSVGQYACAVALDHPELSDMICKTFADRRSVLLKGLKHIEGIKCNCPRGAFYVFADISSFGLTSAEFCNRLLDEEKVVCIPGSAFGTCGEGFIRIAYTCAEEDLNKAILRIQRFCKKLSEKKG